MIISRGRVAAEDPNEVALNVLLASLTLILRDGRGDAAAGWPTTRARRRAWFIWSR